MKFISWNVNGIRAVERKEELQKMIIREKPDVLFLQETKAHKEQLSDYLVAHSEYDQEYHSAQKKGYSGVSVWIKKKIFKKKPSIITGMPGWNDSEGRVICVNYKAYSFFGVYFPNGGKSKEAWQEKLRFYDHFLDHVNKQRKNTQKIVFCGDLNVAHNEIDLARPRENEKNIGFLPEERAWVDRLIEEKWVDIFRYQHPNEVSYTWWDMPSKARERNVGWRIDYFFIDKALLDQVSHCSHINEQMGSDHCPVQLTIKVL